jgi:hypothetical protein
MKLIRLWRVEPKDIFEIASTQGAEAMCGRFVQFSSLRTLEKHFNFQVEPADVSANYNVAPTQKGC